MVRLGRAGIATVGGMAALLAFGAGARAQEQRSAPSQDVEQVTAEAGQTPGSPALTADRPLYRALQNAKKDLAEKYGIAWAIEDTVIYQHASGGVDPDDAAVNTLGVFATWKMFRSQDGKDFAGVGFQGETRGNPFDGRFVDMAADLGTLWSPNDSTSDDYTKIAQLWWGQRLAGGRIGYVIGKIDPGAYINGNRFAGSGNTQFFGQPFATNPARSFPDNGMGLLTRFEPADWVYGHFVMSDGDAVSTYSPFKTIDGRWFYGGEVGLKPRVGSLGQGVYRVMAYYREGKSAEEVGWSLSADQNLGESYGVFLRYGGNEARINAIEQIVSAGISFLQPFGRVSDQSGVGVSWTRPADEDLRDEYSAEMYYRLQLTEGVELSASAQLIVDPSAADRDATGVFGVRARLLY